MIRNNNKLPDTTEVENEDGTITRISFKYKNNEIIKSTTKFKLVEDIIKKSKRVIERNERLKNKKFGNAKDNCNDITFVDINECKILTPSEWNEEDESNINEDIKFKKKNNYNNNQGRGNYNNNQGKGNYNNSQGKGNYNNNQGKGNYNNSQGKGSYNKNKDIYNYYSIRISNISSNITENDLHDLACIFGSIKKITIAKDRDSRKSKGYAFVNFSDKKCAKNALDNLNGHGYDNMILSVEYSRNIS